MGKRQKTGAFIGTFLITIAAFFLTGCQSRPELKQVPSGAPEKPINTEEAAAQLKQIHQK